MKNRNIFAALLIGCICLWQVPSASADTFTFATLPAGGNISGPAGSTIGWGYTIENQSASYWLMLTGLSADPFFNGTPNSIFDFPILAPLTTLSVPYNSATFAGLYELTWDLTAPVGFVNAGTFTVSAEWYDADPLDPDAGANFVEYALDSTAPYSATVTVPPTTSVPEPSTLLLVIPGGLALFWVQRRTVTQRRNVSKRSQLSDSTLTQKWHDAKAFRRLTSPGDVRLRTQTNCRT